MDQVHPEQGHHDRPATSTSDDAAATTTATTARHERQWGPAPKSDAQHDA